MVCKVYKFRSCGFRVAGFSVTGYWVAGFRVEGLRGKELRVKGFSVLGMGLVRLWLWVRRQTDLLLESLRCKWGFLRRGLWDVSTRRRF